MRIPGERNHCGGQPRRGFSAANLAEQPVGVSSLTIWKAYGPGDTDQKCRLHYSSITRAKRKFIVLVQVQAAFALPNRLRASLGCTDGELLALSREALISTAHQSKFFAAKVKGRKT